MHLQYSAFLKRYGVRRAGRLAVPPINSVKEIGLPRNVVLHYLGDGESLGLDQNHPFVVDTGKPAVLHNNTQLAATTGRPKREGGTSIASLVNSYRKDNRRMRMVGDEDITSLTDDRVLLVENYAMLKRAWKYPKAPLSTFSEWYNQERTFLDRAIAIAEETDRQQFRVIVLDDLLPKSSELMVAESSRNATSLDPFKTEGALVLLDIWTWLSGNNRENSVLGTVPKSALRRMNYVFVFQDRWSFVNLGLLNGWRTETQQEDDEDGDGVIAEMSGDQLKKKFLAFTVGVCAGEVHSDAGVTKGDTAPKQNKLASDDEDDDTIDLDIGDDEDSIIDPDEGDDFTEDGVGDNDDDQGPDVDTIIEDNDRMVEDARSEVVDEDESETTGSTTPVIVASEEDAEEYTPVSRDLDAAVKERARKAAASGRLSGAQYRRMLELSNSYKSIKNPLGDESLDKFIDIDPDILEMKEPPKVKKLDGVTDESMLQSTLLEFDDRYIKDVLKRDIAGMCLGVQRAGIAVTGFDTEDVVTATNDYTIYNLEVTPVVGQKTKLPFKIPTVQEDGTFISDGVRYYLKKQRVDAPIRKVNPHRVALTSYYGKVFVDRNQKATANYGRWLCNLITAHGLDDEYELVKHIRTANVFDNHAKVPHVYSALSMRFASFELRNMPLTFNYQARIEKYGEENVVKAEQGGRYVVVGTVGARSKTLVVMDQDGVLFDTSTMKELGTVETLAGLPVEKKPVEMAMLKVLNQNIPIGVVMGYRIGISSLIKTLKLKPRRVPKGGRLDMTPDEFRIRFADQSLVFSRKDRQSAMIMHGFNEYHREIARFKYSEFDKEDVYLNVIGSSNGGRYLNEIDNLFNMFVDPIAEKLLIELNEPTDFGLLLFRSVELLMTDYHPDETDLDQMLIRGYERFAGVVYSELVKSARNFNRNTNNARARFDLNPEAVFQNIIQDPAKEIVDDINPIKNLKQKEIVTYGGKGGRSRDSMRSPKSRIYHKSDMGTISEATVDSQQTGVIAYLSADPKLTSLRGTTARYDNNSDGKTRLLSTSALVSPAAEHDD